MANTKPKGLFAEGIWHCNCTPRLPAEHFKVKKEGKNQGRWFYTCQNAEPERCDFFLWDEDAKPREEAAVLNNSRNEPRNTPGIYNTTENAEGQGVGRSGMQIQDVQQRSPSRTLSPSSPPVHSSRTGGALVSMSMKRKAQDLDFDEDEDYFPWPLTGAEEEELTSAADRVSTNPTTPHKAVKTDAYATPATSTRKLPWLDYTSSSTTTSNNAATPTTNLPTPRLTKTPHIPSSATSKTAPTPATDTTPTPTRFKDALSDPNPISTTTSSLTNDVFETLTNANVYLISAHSTALTAVLHRHDMRTQGISKGREISRLAVKAKEAKIVELQARIASLEAEREVDRSVIRKLRFEKDLTREGGGGGGYADAEGEVEL